MSIKVLVESWRIEKKIKDMNKKDIQDFMLGRLENAESFTNDNRNAVLHHLKNIKRKIESVETDLMILEYIRIKDKNIKKEHIIESLDKVKERIEKIFE